MAKSSPRRVASSKAQIASGLQRRPNEPPPSVRRTVAQQRGLIDRGREINHGCGTGSGERPPFGLVEDCGHRHDGVRFYDSDRVDLEAYRKAPPIPARAVEPGGAVIFTSDDVVAGQQVFLKYGLMANGTIWGHGAYLGPDFSAQYLHNWALDVADHAAQARFRRPYVDLTP